MDPTYIELLNGAPPPGWLRMRCGAARSVEQWVLLAVLFTSPLAILPFAVHGVRWGRRPSRCWGHWWRGGSVCRHGSGQGREVRLWPAFSPAAGGERQKPAATRAGFPGHALRKPGEINVPCFARSDPAVPKDLP